MSLDPGIPSEEWITFNDAVVKLARASDSLGPVLRQLEVAYQIAEKHYDLRATNKYGNLGAKLQELQVALDDAHNELIDQRESVIE